MLADQPGDAVPLTCNISEVMSTDKMLQALSSAVSWDLC